MIDAGPPPCGPQSDGGRVECSALETCGGGGTPGICAKDTTFCTEDGWCWERPLPQGNTLHAVSTVSPNDGGPDDVWMVGDNATILRREGGLLYRVRSPLQIDLHGVWADAPEDVWIVGEGGARMHFLQGVWIVQQGSITQTLRALIRGPPNNRLWAVGDACRIAYTDNGSTWVSTASPAGCTCNLAALSRAGAGMAAAGFQYAGGYGACAAVFQQSTWTANNPMFGPGFQSVVEHDGGLFFGTWGGVYELLSDAGFTMVNDAGLTALGETVTGELWGASSDGIAQHRTPDAGWETVSLDGGRGGGATALRIDTQGIGHVVGQNGTMARIDTSAGAGRSDWTPLSFEPCFDVWASDINAVHVVCGFGTYALRAGDGTWDIGGGLAYASQDIWSPGGTSFFAVGALNTLWAGRGAQSNDVPGWNTPNILFGVWGFSSSDLLVGGTSGLFRGRPPPTSPDIRAVALPRLAADGGISTVVDIHGSVDAGLAWVAANEPNGVVFVVQQSDGGIAVDLDDAGAGLSGIWANAADDVWTVGSSGTVFHRTAAGWSPVSAGTDAGLTAAWGEPGRVFVVGEGGTVLRWDGTRFAPEWSGTRFRLNGVSGVSGVGVWAVGDGQAVLRRRP